MKESSDEDMSGVVIVVIECVVSFCEENAGLDQIRVEARPDYVGITGGQVSRDGGWDGRYVPFLRCGHIGSSRVISGNPEGKCCGWSGATTNTLDAIRWVGIRGLVAVG